MLGRIRSGVLEQGTVALIERAGIGQMVIWRQFEGPEFHPSYVPRHSVAVGQVSRLE